MRTASKRVLSFLVLIGSGACQWNCDGGSGSGGSSGTPTVPSYTPYSVEGWESLLFVSPTPSAPFQVESYSLNNDPSELPPGIGFDPRSGVFSGVPTAPHASTVYTVRAHRPGGIVSRGANLRIEIHPAGAPSALAYSPNPIVGPSDSSVNSTPTVTGVVQTYTIDPALPRGLALDPDTGVIAGALEFALGTAQYTVTAENPFGATQATVEITATVTKSVQGLLVMSAQDFTVDAYGFGADPLSLSARDFESFGRVTPRAVAADSAGERVYVATASNELYYVRRDPVSGALSTPVNVGSSVDARRMAVAFGDRFLLVARNTEVLRFAIQPNGTLVADGQAPGPPSGASAIAVGPSNSYLALGASSPGSVWIYDIEPTLQLRGVQFPIGAQAEVSDMVIAGTKLYAATSTYNFSTHVYEGHLRSFTVASRAQVDAGAAALVQVQNLSLGEHLTGIAAVPFGATADLAITDSGLGRVYLADTFGGPIATPVPYSSVAGAPLDCVAVALQPSGFPMLFVLDSVNERIRLYGLASQLVFYREFATRALAIEMLGVRGDLASAESDAAFVPGRTDFDLRSFHADSTFGFAASPQPPQSTGVAAYDVAAHPTLPVVYTALRDSGKLGVYAYDAATEQFSLLEEEAMSPGSRPLSLALGLGGRVLFAADEGGRVTHSAVDPTTGELTAFGGQGVFGSMANARLRADPIGRYVYLVQSGAGAVTTFTVFPDSGFPLATSINNSLGEPTDLAVSTDGRFVYVLDAASASIANFRVDSVNGELQLLGASTSLGGAPTRIAVSDWAGASWMFAIDPSTDTCRYSVRDRNSGWVGPSMTYSFQVAGGVTAITPFQTLARNGLLLAHQDSGVATITSYEQNSTYAYSLLSTQPVGQGPAEIEARLRFVAD